MSTIFGLWWLHAVAVFAKRLALGFVRFRIFGPVFLQIWIKSAYSNNLKLDQKCQVIHVVISFGDKVSGPQSHVITSSIFLTGPKS